MHLTDMDEAFLALLDQKPADVFPAAAVVGDISRTWFDDKTLMVCLFELLQEHQPDFYIAIHGAHGFDRCARDAATCLGIEAVSYSFDAEWREKFDYKTHPANLLAAGWMLIVMVRRKEKGSLFERCYDVDPVTFEAALELGVPIFAVNEDGEIKGVK